MGEQSFDYESGRELSLQHDDANVLILDFLPSRNVGNRRALFINHPVSSIFLWKPRWTKTLLQLICRKQRGGTHETQEETIQSDLRMLYWGV